MALHEAEPRVDVIPGASEGKQSFEVKTAVQSGRCQGRRSQFQIRNGIGGSELGAAGDPGALFKTARDTSQIPCTDLSCRKIDRSQLLAKGNIATRRLHARVYFLGRVRLNVLANRCRTLKSRQEQKPDKT